MQTTHSNPFAFHPFNLLWKGVNEMKKPVLKIGIVRLDDLGGGKWSLRYRCPQTGADVRRRLQGINRKEALQVASTVSMNALSMQGYLPGSSHTLPTVHAAIAETIKMSRARDYIKTDMGKRGTMFEQWLAEHYPAVKTWDALKPYMIERWVRDMETTFKPYTVRNRLQVVRMTWKRMTENYPDQCRPLPEIRLKADPPKPVDVLSPTELAAYLDHLRESDPYIHAFESVRFYTGLRMLETSSLRIQDVDLVNGLLTITATPTHTPKTKTSYRTLPIAEEALSALRRWIDGQPAIPLTGEIFRNRRGHVWNADHVSRMVKGWMRKAAKASGIPRLAEVQPHILRATCSTYLSQMGIQDRLVQAFLGHAGSTVLAVHYQAVHMEELRLVSDRLNEWRRMINADGVGNILATPIGKKSATR